MAKHLDSQEVRKWLEGQRAAEQVIERERVRLLQDLTPEESLRIYLSLKEAAPRDPEAEREPSPLLMAMRRMLDRYAKMKGREDCTDASPNGGTEAETA